MQIQTIGPALAILNGTRMKHAKFIAARLREDLGIPKTTLRRSKEGDSGDGWYGYALHTKTGTIPVSIPGVPWEFVRWSHGKRLPVRLYVDGGSWQYDFAVDVLRGHLEGKYDDA